ncbi:MAG: FkbM family methyltransferase [Bacteroidetes bacterium]|nr:FkbM family methyltransferase [Bacteroidota bacterium]
MPRQFRTLIRSWAKRVLPSFALDGLQGLYYPFWVLPRASVSDEPDIEVVRAFLRPGDTAIDPGANYGSYTDAMASCVASGGEVLAIEPIPRTFKLLKAVVRYRRLQGVLCVNAAVSDRKSIAEMTIPEMGDALNFYRASLDRSDVSGDTVSVETDTLDSLASQLEEAPVFVKLDLEGHEGTALAGASRLLEALPAWLLELPDDPDDPASDATAIEELMHLRGYTSWWYDADPRVLRRRKRGARPINLFYFTADHLERLKDAPFSIEPANPETANHVTM